MNDKELLELAAKASGIESYRYGDAVYPRTHVWNPLTNDGDALRLAVKLSLGVLSEGPSSVAWYFNIREDVINGNNPYAATRRAIVRAAAEIGKGMK